MYISPFTPSKKVVKNGKVENDKVVKNDKVIENDKVVKNNKVVNDDNVRGGDPQEEGKSLRGILEGGPRGGELQVRIFERDA